MYHLPIRFILLINDNPLPLLISLHYLGHISVLCTPSGGGGPSCSAAHTYVTSGRGTSASNAADGSHAAAAPDAVLIVGGADH